MVLLLLLLKVRFKGTELARVSGPARLATSPLKAACLACKDELPVSASMFGAERILAACEKA